MSLEMSQILIAPVVSEKSYRLIEERKYCFRVHDDAHKTQVRQAVEAWISSGESRSSLMLSWIRDVPSLGAAARGLQRDAMENFIEMVRTLGDNAEFRAAGVGPFSRQRIIMLLGGLQELTAITVEEGGRMSDVTEEAVEASIALLAPRVQPD